MSKWNYIHGYIEVHTNAASSEETCAIVKKAMKNLPTINGSEYDARLYFNLKDSMSYCRCDSTNNEFNEVKSDAIITVEGELRDKDIEDTLNELKEMIQELNSGDIWVAKVLVCVSDGWEEVIIKQGGHNATGKVYVSSIDNAIKVLSEGKKFLFV